MNIKSIILCALAIIVSQVLGAQDKISETLNKRHLQSTIRYYSPDETSMRYSRKTKRGKRTSLQELQFLMNRMESSGLLDGQKDSITVIASVGGISHLINECIVSCNNGLYLVCFNGEMYSPYKLFQSTDELVGFIGPKQMFDASYQEKLSMLMDTFILWDVQKSIELIKLIGSPGNYELQTDYLWKIVIDDGKIISDQLISFDPLGLSLNYIKTESIQKIAH
jgi:hypothetical protein